MHVRSWLVLHAGLALSFLPDADRGIMELTALQIESSPASIMSASNAALLHMVRYLMLSMKMPCTGHSKHVRWRHIENQGALDRGRRHRSSHCNRARMAVRARLEGSIAGRKVALAGACLGLRWGFRVCYCARCTAVTALVTVAQKGCQPAWNVVLSINQALLAPCAKVLWGQGAAATQRALSPGSA